MTLEPPDNPIMTCSLDAKLSGSLWPKEGNVGCLVCSTIIVQTDIKVSMDVAVARRNAAGSWDILVLGQDFFFLSLQIQIKWLGASQDLQMTDSFPHFVKCPIRVFFGLFFIFFCIDLLWQRCLDLTETVFFPAWAKYRSLIYFSINSGTLKDCYHHEWWLKCYDSVVRMYGIITLWKDVPTAIAEDIHVPRVWILKNKTFLGDPTELCGQNVPKHHVPWHFLWTFMLFRRCTPSILDTLMK